MDKDAVVEIVMRFRKALESRGVRVAKLILFGSYATGRQWEGSDIDLVVVSDDFRGKNFWDRTGMLAEAVYEVFQPIEAVAMTPEEWERGGSTIAEYARKGMVLVG